MPSLEELRNFWETAKAELSQTPLQAEVKPADPSPDGRANYCWVEMSSLGGVRIGGWYGVPNHARPGRLPAVLTVPGYGGECPPEFQWPHEGYATLTLFPRGQGESRRFWDVPAGRTKLTLGLQAPEQHYYRAAYLDCLRGLAFLRSREEVDPTRVGVLATSQGGGLSLATAALDDDLAVCGAHVPFLCNYPVALETATTGPYLELTEYFAAHPEEKERGLETLAWLDPVNLAPLITCPTIMSLGEQDTTCPPATIEPVFQRIPAAKALLSYPDLPHAHSQQFRRVVRAWLALYL
jgi:cephalosporin-C deacetylase